MATAVNAVLNQHLTECRDRYVATESKLDLVAKEIKSLVYKIGGSTIGLLIAIISYLLVHSGLTPH